MPLISGRSIIPVSGGPTYVGPGDIVSGAAMWWGLRAYNAAYAVGGANPAIDLVDQAGANPITINILSNGALDLASVAAWVTAHSVTTILVAKWYDQTGGGFHLLQGTNANRPLLVLSGLGINPVVQFVQASSTTVVASSVYTQAQPLSCSIVYEKTTSGTCDIISSGCAIVAQGANDLRMFAGGVLDAVANDNVFHAAQTVFNSASSAAYIDGVTTTGNAGTAGASNNPEIGGAVLSNALQGNVFEGGFWPLGFSSIQAGALNSNQHTYGGF